MTRIHSGVLVTMLIAAFLYGGAVGAAVHGVVADGQAAEVRAELDQCVEDLNDVTDTTED